MFRGLSKKDVMQSFLGASFMVVIGYAFSVLLMIALR